MKRIYKYTLNPSNLTIPMPIGAKLISMHRQKGEMCIWAEVDIEEKTELVTFEIFTTGEEITSDNKEFVGTFLLHNESLVFHIYKMT